MMDYNDQVISSANDLDELETGILSDQVQKKLRIANLKPHEVKFAWVPDPSNIHELEFLHKGATGDNLIIIKKWYGEQTILCVGPKDHIKRIIAKNKKPIWLPTGFQEKRPQVK